MFGFFNLFWKKKPSVEITIEVSIPKYEPSANTLVSEYIPPPPAKIHENACCPYCGVVFDTPPTRKKKCGDCGWYVYVRTSEDRVKLYLTQEQVEIFEQEKRLESLEEIIGRYGYSLSSDQKYAFVRDEALLASGIAYYLAQAMKKSIIEKDYHTTASISYDLDYLYRSSPLYGKGHDDSYIKQAEEWSKKATNDWSF